MSIFYRPSDAVCADFIPYYENGVYYLFYLKDYRDPEGHGEGTPWFLVTTRDFVRFEEHGEVLPRGTRDEQDLYVFTGSVCKALGAYHIFYTGHNPHLRQRGLPEQAVMHAVSDDLITWRKQSQDTFFAPEEYEPHDWRDPFVYWDEAAQEYRMLLAARHRQGAPRRRGMTALCGSKDLKRWQVLDPFWAPDLFFTHECPDLFRMGPWYYLIYSEFSQEKVTRYRMSRSLNGPWLAPADDRLDGVAYYAAKTGGTEAHRYLFGWIPSRADACDQGAWQWGGCLCVHELCQRADGTLCTQLPASVWEAAADKKLAGGRSELEKASGMKSLLLATIPDTCALEFHCEGSAQAFELLLHMDTCCDEGTMLRIDLANQQLMLDQWPRAGEQACLPGLIRPLPPNRGEHTIRILLDDSALCAYVDGEVSLCGRIYNRHDHRLGIAVTDGRMAFEWAVYQPR